MGRSIARNTGCARSPVRSASRTAKDWIQISIEQSDAIPGVPTYFIRNDYLYDRDSLYGQADDDHRFVAYSRAIMEMLDEDRLDAGCDQL